MKGGASHAKDFTALVITVTNASLLYEVDYPEEAAEPSVTYKEICQTTGQFRVLGAVDNMGTGTIDFDTIVSGTVLSSVIAYHSYGETVSFPTKFVVITLEEGCTLRINPEVSEALTLKHTIIGDGTFVSE